MTPTGKILEEEWMGDEATYQKYLEEGRIYFPRGGDGMPRKKYYQCRFLASSSLENIMEHHLE